MKKIIFSFTCWALYPGAIMAQIPNFSFENWTTMGSYENTAMWGTMNNTTAAHGVYTATKASPGNPGSYYLMLTSKTVGTGVVNGIAVSGQLDSITMQPKSGFAFIQRPQSFIGQMKHMSYGSSQGSIMVTLTRWNTGLNQRVTVGTANQTLSGMVMSWTNFTINFNYVDGGYPDTCNIVLKSSGANPTNNDYLYIDNLAFIGSVVGIENHNSFLNNMSVYPNPSNSSIVLDLNFKSPQQTSIDLTDLVGKVVLAKNAGVLHGETKQILDVSAIAKGAYFVRIVSESGAEVKKIVIE